ncbi:MAG TPA: arginine--tRNA ligase, partial [Gammaproteobacteria bacterium]|nr:arginine--tRNA ligase [Gammaproteobacteria bacterium]
GQFVTLRQLREEVGTDAARFFYCMRSAEQHMDFDLELAKSQSNENPVYYVQYAHARICSVMRQAKSKNLIWDRDKGLSHLDRLCEPQEIALLKRLEQFTELLQQASDQLEVHPVANYVRQLAADLHAYYNAHTFIVEDEQLCQARLTLVQATRQVLKNGLTLLGVSQPESM